MPHPQVEDKRLALAPQRRDLPGLPVPDVRLLRQVHSFPASHIFATEISGLRTGAIWNMMFLGCPSLVLL